VAYPSDKIIKFFHMIGSHFRRHFSYFTLANNDLHNEIVFPVVIFANSFGPMLGSIITSMCQAYRELPVGPLGLTPQSNITLLLFNS